MASTSNVIYLRQYKARKKFHHLKKIIFSKDTLFAIFFIIFIVVLLIVAGIASYYDYSSPLFDKISTNIADIYTFELK
ncbi:hypothetical protein SAMN04489735_101858 [Aneurinibacillus thermoaerophilus]|uniref:Uncharacterized protein n=1 Tax=Aneurinibacillus thermoaerophilus TaxID=143495 RepID=A0A1G8AW58_ANETH|nr:hypothetical protein SAMN04489735_101858 [Aneurinibacillus thermoaerophilus]